MALKTIKQNQYTYFELHMNCPVCTSNGVFTPQSFWTHHSCGGTIYLGENAFYKCESCNSMNHVKTWKYGCPTHGSETGYEFIGVTAGELAASIAVAGMIVNQAGVAWLQAFLSNMGEF